MTHFAVIRNNEILYFLFVVGLKIVHVIIIIKDIAFDVVYLGLEVAHEVAICSCAKLVIPKKPAVLLIHILNIDLVTEHQNIANLIII